MTTVDILRAVFAGVVLFVACPLLWVYWPQIMRALGYGQDGLPPGATRISLDERARLMEHTAQLRDEWGDGIFPPDWVEEFEWRRSL